MTTSPPARDHFIEIALEQGKDDNIAAAIRVAKVLREKLGEREATDRDVQHELLIYAAHVDQEDLVKMWVALAYPLVKD